MPRRSRLAGVLMLTVAVLVASLPRSAFAGRLDAIVARVTEKSRAQGTSAKERKAYKALKKTLRKPNPKGLLSQDAAKLLAVAAAVRAKLANDQTLAGLLETALDEASHELSGLPDTVAEEIDKLASPTDRQNVEKRALDGYAAWLEGRSQRGSAREAAKVFIKAAKIYEAALKLAQKRLKKQGEPLPTTMTPDPQRVYTFVGSGAPGFNGDGRPARRSSLYYVEEMAFAPDGRLVILDWNNHMVRRLKSDGTLERLCGSGVPGDSEGEPLATALNHPSSLTFGPDGRIFLAAWHNHKVKVYDETGSAPVVYTIAGGTQGNAGADGTPATDARYNLLPGILRIPNGDLLTIDAANQVIRRVALSTPLMAVNIAGVTVETGPISRFAGITGQSGVTGDGGDKLSAKLAFSKAQDAEPDGRMARDAEGSIYVVSGIAHVIRKIDANGIITTFAGDGTAGFSGDGGPANQAQLDRPSDVAVGSDGSVYISDANNHVIRKVANGIISTFAGLGKTSGAPAEGVTLADARFNRPGGLEFDANGNLLVADRYNNVIRVITSAAPGSLQVPITPYVLPLPARGAPPAKGASGTIDTYAGSGTLGFNGDNKALDTHLYWPQDMTVDPSTGPGSGEVYFLDWNNHRVRKVGNDGNIVTVIGSGELGDTVGPAESARMNHPTDLAFHPLDGALWVAAWHTDKILRLNGSDHTIAYMAGAGRGFHGDGGPASAAIMNLPSSVKFDAAGNWYVGDEGNRRVRFVDAATNVITTLAGTGQEDPLNDDGPAANAGLAFPVGQSAQPGGRVALSPDDRYLYVADSNHHRVRRIDLQSADKIITTIAGNGAAGLSGDGGPATSAQLNSPVDVDCDAAGNVYVADRDNHAIRKIDVATGTITSIAGVGTEGYAGDKGPASAAHLRTPSGVFVVRSGAQAGRIYIADTYNGVLRVIWE